MTSYLLRVAGWLQWIEVGEWGVAVNTSEQLKMNSTKKLSFSCVDEVNSYCAIVVAFSTPSLPGPPPRASKIEPADKIRVGRCK